LGHGEIALLENVRFDKEETANDETFSKELAKLADISVNNAFGTAHRANASTAEITKIPSLNVADFLIDCEMKILDEKIVHPKRAFIVILSGATINDQISVIDVLLDKANNINIGSAMVYTFPLTQRHKIDNSLIRGVPTRLFVRSLKICNKFALYTYVKYYLLIISKNIPIVLVYYHDDS
jgi:phosphoglycerate kinase